MYRASKQTTAADPEMGFSSTFVGLPIGSWSRQEKWIEIENIYTDAHRHLISVDNYHNEASAFYL